MRKEAAENLLMLLLCFCFVFLFKSVTVNAAIVRETEAYELGDTYEGRITYSEQARYFKFTISEKSHVTLNFKGNGAGSGGTIYDFAGREVLKESDFTFDTNFFTGWSSVKISRTLPSGTYYMSIWNKGKWKWQEYKFSFCIQAESQIQLPKGNIQFLESNQKGQVTVKAEAVEHAIGYRILYSTDERLLEGVKTIYSPITIKTITNLKVGERYYIKVCPYTVYDDGTYIFGQNSFVKAVLIKEKY